MMRIDTAYICLRDLRFRAFHGVMAQERQVGAYFTIDLRVGYPLQKAVESDQVADTLNYAALYELVKREMAQPSNLLEHVAGRIAQAIGEAFPQVRSIDLTLTKDNPPIGADCKGAAVEIHFVNDK